MPIDSGTSREVNKKRKIVDHLPIAEQVKKFKEQKEAEGRWVHCPVFKGEFTRKQCLSNQSRLLYDAQQADGPEDSSYAMLCSDKVKACKSCQHNVKGLGPKAPVKVVYRPNPK